MTKMQDYMVEAKDMIECADSGDFISRLPEHVARLLAEIDTDCANIADEEEREEKAAKLRRALGALLEYTFTTMEKPNLTTVKIEAGE